jgi:glycosyltransferase involved in cell wall biosynthesis
MGFQDNPYMFMAHFDVLVLPSLYETFSYVSIEAMTCGVPVISTRWYGCEEIYNNMNNCILVSINNSEELAEAIFRVLIDNELKNKLRKNAMELVYKYDVSKVVPQYEQAIMNVLETVNS